MLLLALTLQPQAPAAEPASTVRVAFLQGEQLVQVRRPGRTAADAVRQLISGLMRAEVVKSFRTYVPPRTRLRRLTIRNGLATVDLNTRFVSGQSNEKVLASLSQLVQTLSSFSQVTPFREWLPWALPFVGGIAFHEFADVPVFPASHGCVRQSFAVARWTYGFAEVGMPVRVLARS